MSEIRCLIYSKTSEVRSDMRYHVRLGKQDIKQLCDQICEIRQVKIRCERSEIKDHTSHQTCQIFDMQDQTIKRSKIQQT